MQNLDRYYSQLKEICHKDVDDVVHLNSERVALDNTISNGYIYLSGEVDFKTVSGCVGEYITTTPLVFVGAIPGGITEAVFEATIGAMTGSNVEILGASIDKSFIAERENIDLDKFVGVTLIRVVYQIKESKIYDPNCDLDICYC